MLSRILVFVGGLLVVALFAALIAPLFVDWTDFRKDFEREASRIMGKPVVVYGSVDARLIPFPSVTLNDVRVGQSESGEPLIQVARFSMDAELAPFLSGEALIFDMRLEQPKAKVRLLPDGTLDWARGRKASIPAKVVILENVAIAGGQIDFIDEQTGRTRRITGLEADLSARSLAGPWKMEGRAALDGEAGSFSFSSSEADDEAGTLGLRARLTPDKRPFGVELDGDLKIVDFKPLYQGKFTLTENKPAEAQPVSDQSGALRVTGAFELTNERIRVPEYRLEIGPKDDPYLVTGEATLDTGKEQEFLLLADGQQIDVSRIGNGGEAGKTGRDPAISVRQRLAAMMAIAADIPIPQVPGRASLKLPAIVIGDTTVRDVRLDLRPDGAGWMVDKAVAQLPGRTQFEAEGRLQLSGQRAFRGAMLVASNQPSGLAAWVAGSVDPAIRKLKTAGFSATVNLTDTLQQFERLELAAGPAVLRGRIERQALDGVPPSLSLQLKGNRIDLEALQALAGLVAGDASNETVLSHTIAADLSAEHFSAFDEDASYVQLVATLKNGQLQAERVSIGDIAGTQLALSGRMSGDFSTPVVSAKMKLASPDLTPFLAMIERHAAHPVLERLVKSGSYYADAALDVTVTSGGQDGKAPVTFGIIGTANGTKIAANYQAPNVAQALTGQGILLEATMENPSTPVLLGQIGFDPLPFDVDTNAIFSVKLQGTDGQKANGSLTFTTERTSLTANGDIDLSRENFLSGQSKIVLESRDFEPFLLLQGIGLPQMGTGLPLALKADIATTPEAVTLSEIEGKADSNAFSGTIAIDRKTPGKVTGKMALDTLDLAWIGEGIIGPVEEATSGDLSTSPVVQPPWSGLDVALDFSTKRFWPGIYGAVSDLTGKLVWKGDQIEFGTLAGNWLGGKVEGRLLLGNGDGSGFFQTRLDLKDADLAAAAWTAGGTAVAEAKVDLTIAMEASGKTARAMAESASGSGTATLRDTVVHGLNTAALPDIIAAADRLEGEITADVIKPIAEKHVLTGQAALGAVTVPFNIAGGTLRAQNVTAGDAAAALSANAEISFPDERMKAGVTVDFHPGEEALTGAEPQVKLSYAGLLKSPGLTLDATDLSNYLSLRAFERERRRVETLQANVLEKQRLRREVALYKANAGEREAARLRAIEEERRRQLAVETAARQKAEAEARALAEKKAAEDAAAAKAAEAARKAEEQKNLLPFDPTGGVLRGGALAAPQDGGTTGQPADEQPTVQTPPQGLDFNTLPGVTAQ